MLDDASNFDPEKLGRLRFLIDGLEGLGISLSLIPVLAVMMVFFLLKGIVKFGNLAYRAVLRQRFVRMLRFELIRLFSRLTYRYYALADVGRVQNTVSGEVDRVSRSFHDYFRAMEQLVLLFVYVVFAFYIDPLFTLLVTFGGLVTNIVYKIIYRKTKNTSRLFSKDSHVYQGQIIQYVANFKYLKATGLLKTFAQKIRLTVQKIELSRRRLAIYRGLLESAREPMLIIVVVGVIVVQVQMMGRALGPIVISLLFFYRALNALMKMQNSWNSYLIAYGSLENVIAFKSELKENVDTPGEKQITKFQQEIFLEDVVFSYEEKEVLHGVSLRIPKNKTIAFVGESGSGKTTLVSLVAGLLLTDSGTVLVDGIPMHSIDRRSYQSRIGYVTQEPVIFNDSIFANVTVWAERTPENLTRFHKAIEQAAVAEFINTLPDGEDTVLGNNGVNLSGGQKQRISIARELYKDVDLLIMDEATSALDSETEKAIQSSIDALQGRYTILMVAHRLSTVKRADMIVLMKDGTIRESGSFKELIDQSSVFERMVELQKLV